MLYQTSGGKSLDATVPALLNLPTPNSTTELMAVTDPGTLPPRARQIYLSLGEALVEGYRPKEFSDLVGERPGWSSEQSRELQSAVRFVNGVFPDLDYDEYAELLWSIAENGIRVPVIVDEAGIIDGRARAKAFYELEWIASTAETDPGNADLAKYDPELVALASERNFVNPPIDRREGLSWQERREVAVRENAAPRGRKLRRDDLRTLIEVELTLNPDRTDRATARLLGCDHSYVSRIKREMELEAEAFVNAEITSVDSPHPVWKILSDALACPHCQHQLALERAGRDYRLELTEAA